MAEFFGKAHKNVLADIDRIRHSAGISAEWFQDTVTEVHVGFGTRQDRAVDMTRDGFSLLVMGYTGPKAMEFKVRYIEQFNAMEAELSKQQKQPQVPQSYAEALRAAAGFRCFRLEGVVRSNLSNPALQRR